MGMILKIIILSYYGNPRVWHDTQAEAVPTGNNFRFFINTPILQLRNSHFDVEQDEHSAR
jgi:hypothetical protein